MTLTTHESKQAEYNKNLADAIAKANEASLNMQRLLQEAGFTLQVNGTVSKTDSQVIWITRPSVHEEWKERVRISLTNPYGGVRFAVEFELFTCQGARGKNRRFSNFEPSNLKKIVRTMTERITMFKEYRERETQGRIDSMKWEILRRKTLAGIVVPPSLRIQIVQEVDDESAAPKPDQVPSFSLSFNTYGTANLSGFHFTKEQVQAICEGFQKAMDLDSRYVIRLPSLEANDEGKRSREYYTGSWITKFINEANLYPTKEKAEAAAASASENIRSRAQVVPYVGEFTGNVPGLYETLIRS